MERYKIRRADLDDSNAIEDLLNSSGVTELYSELYDKKPVLELLETSVLSIAIQDQNNEVIGAAVFNDIPQFLKGSTDHIHFNNWDSWLPASFELSEKLTPMNTLWMIFYFVEDEEFTPDLTHEILQHLYETLPSIEYVLYVVQSLNNDNNDLVQLSLANWFEEVNELDRSKLNNVLGFSSEASLFCSERQKVCPELIIRLANEEDHDDLAEIFNNYSEVLTNVYGEFFLADLIATFNQTRNITKALKSAGKALVAESDKKAYGLMSLSTEIDYKLLNEHFDLSSYDYLLDPDFPLALECRRSQIVKMREFQVQQEQRKALKNLKYEIYQAKWIGQRMMLQEFCIKKEIDMKVEMENFLNNVELNKTLDLKAVKALIETWLKDFSFFRPSKEVAEAYPNNEDIFSVIQSKVEFFLETLGYFGLPANYLNGEGHWKDWEKKVLEEQKAASLKRPIKKGKKDIRKKTKKDEEKKEEMKPPSYFDMAPLYQAFVKFVAANAEARALVAGAFSEHQKEFMNYFLFPNGEVNPDRCVDMNSFAEKINEKVVQLPSAIFGDVFSGMLECFSDFSFLTKIEQVLMVEKKDESKEKAKPKSDALKKFAELNEGPKLVEVTRKYVSFSELQSCLEVMWDYDKTLSELGKVNSEILRKITKETLETEEKEAQMQQEKLLETLQDLEEGVHAYYMEYVKTLEDPFVFPEYVMPQAFNAVVINLFCIEWIFESRSVDFIPYAFELFPDCDYLILTQPHSVPENSLLQMFSLAPKKIESNFEHVLYIIHRDSLQGSKLKVRRTLPSDFEKIMELIGVEDNESVALTQKSLADPGSQIVSFSVECSDHLVGHFLVSMNIDYDYYTTHFSLQDYLLLDFHGPSSMIRIESGVLNPIFNKYSRSIIREIMRYTDKTCVFFEASHKSVLPSFFREFSLLKVKKVAKLLNRPYDLDKDFLSNPPGKDKQRFALDEKMAPFALGLISKREMSTYKKNINTRIVVVGASDTGLSAVENLLQLQESVFTSIFLLAPGGLPNMQVQEHSDFLKAFSTSYENCEIDGMLLDGRINVIDSKIVYSG